MINYNEIEKLLISTLENETPSSLREWLNTKKNEEMIADLGEGEYQPLEIESSEFCHSPNNTKVAKPVMNAGEYNYSIAA